MSFLRDLSSTLSDPLTSSLLVGVSSASYFFFGNLGGAWFGVVPAIKDRSVYLSPAKRIQLWQWYYDIAKLHMPTSSTLSLLAFALGAYLAPTSSNLRTLALIAAAFQLPIVPFTVVAMLPVNNELVRINRLHLLGTGDRKSDDVAANEGTAQVALDAEKKVDQWIKLHRVRLALGGISWAVGLLALAAKN